MDDDWPTAWTVDAGQVARWWSGEPYSVLVACGRGVDGLEVPGTAARRVLGALDAAEVRPPAMWTPVGTLVFFVRSPAGPPPMLTWASWRSAGSWVGVPPTGHNGTIGGRGYRWAPGGSPEHVQWKLPDLTGVHEIVIAAVFSVPLRLSPRGRLHPSGARNRPKRGNPPMDAQ